MSARPTTGAEALARLLDGNGRFVGGQPDPEPYAGGVRAELAQGQFPFAVILSCADSRVPLEMVFDRGPGDIFVVRVAGNTATHPVLLGSIEYGVAVLGAVLLVVLGHQLCGAVTAALDQVERGTSLPGDIQAVVDPVLPAARAVAGGPAEGRLDRAVRENIRRQVRLLETSPSVLAPAVSAGRLMVVGAEFSLATGRVAIVD